ncbi:MAG: NAD-dependent epimerase/dehydratase family protein [Candidatus Rokubacteria bacterium]|nr:NAD-dependent epimerase/dehydratase family protein [Candidatus Rokubacteria bacterium]
MRVLVTGGAGFIGSHLVERLLGEGHAVRVLDDFSTGRRENLASAKPGAALEVVTGDIRDARAVASAVAGVEAIFHEAALVSVPRSVESPEISCDINAHGTARVFDAARRAGIRRLVFASSAAVYGETARGPVSEREPVRPLSPYGVDKLYTEHLAALYHALYGVETVPLRYFNVFGPRQDPSSAYSGVISIFVSRLLAGDPITIHGDGKQTRDFVYVADVVEANMRAMFSPYPGPSPLNVARGDHTTLNALATMLGEILGVTPQIIGGPARAGDIRHSVADITAIRSALGYEPKWTVASGLKALVTSLRPV